MKARSAHRPYRFTILQPALWSPVIWFTVSLRVIGALFIFFQPLIGIIISYFLDWFDSYLLIQRAGISRAQYHMLDKNLDEFWSVIMLIVGWHTPFVGLLAGLFVYRLIGHLVYLATNDTRIFLLFPNVFDFVFLWFVALRPWVSVASAMYFWQVIIVLTGLKVIQEIVLHWIWPARLRYMKKHWHGYSPFLRSLGWRRLGI